jgi:O-antigen ligase
MLAAFVAMVFFIPIASTELKLHLPVDSRIDRFAIILLVLSWMWFGGDQRAFLQTRRSKLYVTAACMFLAVVVASLLFTAPRIINQGEFPLAEKRFALLASFFVLSWFALTALRFEDVRGFAGYLVGLAAITSIGILVERNTGYNIFYNWTKAILSPIANVEQAPTIIHPKFGGEGRVTIVGPTNQGLAATTMLVMMMPFALVRMFDSRPRSRAWWFHAGAFALMVAAALATDRKTALVVPVALLLYITFYRPRQVLRIAPVGLVVLAGVVHFAAPGAIGTVFNLHANLTSRSTTHRTGDFAAVTPDVLAHPVLGRGYGSIDPDRPDEFRINDNEYLDELWEGGFLGLIAFVGMILAPIVIAYRAIRTRRPTISSLALASSGGCVAFLAACPLFDAMGFPQVPYIFFLVAALTTIAAAGPEGNVESSRELVRRLSASVKPVVARLSTDLEG